MVPNPWAAVPFVTDACRRFAARWAGIFTFIPHQPGAASWTKERCEGDQVTRTIVNFWLDVTLFVTLLAAFWLQLINRVAFPPGTTAQGWSLWGMTFDAWSELQFQVWCGFMLLVVVHVMLHWTWVCGLVASRLTHPKRTLTDGERTLFGVGLLIAVLLVLGTALAVATLNVKMPGAS